MTRILTFAGASLLVTALAAPVHAGQATARSRGGDSTPSSGSGSGSSSSGSESSGGGSGDYSPPVARRAPSVSQPRTGGASAQPRSGSAASGSAGSGASQRGGGSSASAASGDSRLAQSRSSRMATARGQAAARPPYLPVRPNRPSVYLGGYYSPWYFGGRYSSYYGYNPFGLRYSRFGYYGPFGYVPFGAYYADPWDPFMYGGGISSGYSYDRDQDRDDRRRMGSIRLRMNPKHAKVYVDGALVGTVDDFDGLRDHLEVETGRHEIEVRADGYENYRTEVVVASGRTVTERAKLKKATN